MAATDKIEEMIKEVAVKHGIAVGRDDPILILQTINERLMQDSAKAQQEILEQFKEEMEALSMRWGNDTKTKAERILNASLAASKDAMAKFMQEGAEETTASVRKEIDEALGRIAWTIRDTRLIGSMNLAASCITFLAAAVAVWATLR